MSTFDDCRAYFENGNQLSQDQLKALRALPEKEKLALVEYIASSPSDRLPCLEKYGTEGAALVSSALPDKQLSLKVFEFCKYKLSSASDASIAEFYLSVYANIASKYEIDDFLSVPQILDLLAIEHEKLHAIVVFTIVSMSKRKPMETSQAIERYLTGIVDQEPKSISPQQYSSLFETLQALYPLFPEQLKKVYTSDGCKNAILYQVARLTSGRGDIDADKVSKMLQVVSSTCINEASRHFNSQHYLTFLITGSEMTSVPQVVALSLLCIVKLWNFKQIESQISQKTVLSKTVGLLKSELPPSALSAVLEALTYLSLSGTCRSSIFQDEEITDRLLSILKSEKESSNVYGVLLVFANLTKMKDISEVNERRRMKYAASASNPGNQDLGEVSDETVKLYNSALVKSQKVVGTFKKLDLSKVNIMKECVTIIYHLSQNPENALHRSLVMQGGLNLILKYLTTYSGIDKEHANTHGLSTDENELELRVSALRALANMCSSVDPRLAFNEYDIKTAVPFLTELFGLDTSFGPKAKKDATTVIAGLLSQIDQFKALLALTNLCSQPNKELNNLIIKKTFDQHLKNFIIESTNPDIQRASWELINNLIQEPAMLAKFFNPDNSTSMTNLEILVKMLHARDESLQEVIAGLLANSTMEFDLVTTVILSQKGIFDQLKAIAADIFQKQPDASGLMLRLGTFIGNVMDTAEQSGNSDFKKDKQLLLGFQTVVQSTNIPEVFELFTELLKMAVQ
ncbi:hypothetical protein FT663_03976 [Candidozyma haemuli var. vulneris]|nr:hypothetical protein FT663_03976 [[Candida] haemuloni var. vulneris]KAF3990468.1 hypothetical protein FT662_02265 [[Candida] haemuloni var. vulneris]